MWACGLKIFRMTENTVMANRLVSGEQEVISGVPQQTVLTSIFIIIMISYIEENLRNSMIRLFADDTRESAKIRTKEDKELPQQDLDTVYR